MGEIKACYPFRVAGLHDQVDLFFLVKISSSGVYPW